MHSRRACEHNQGPARALACLGRPVATSFIRCSVVTEDSLSRQRWVTLCRDRDFSVATESWAIRAFGIATQFWCCDKGAELMGWFCVVTQSLCRDSGAWTGAIKESCRDREFFVTTYFSRAPVATEVSLSRQSLPIQCRDTTLWCCERAGLAGRCRDSALVTARSSAQRT